ncbi:MAG: hypothetical protein ABIL58_11090 [Pseudomonadota bacterium]
MFMTLYGLSTIDESVKKQFSRKDAKHAKKFIFNINVLTLRSLRLCERFGLFTGASQFKCKKWESASLLSASSASKNGVPAAIGITTSHGGHGENQKQLIFV